jgi:dTDP-4-dehydrorhamnose reductase
MHKLLVTGASGLLGNKIVESARSLYDVVPLHHTRPLHPDSERLDTTNQIEVLDLLTRSRPSALIHTASLTNVDKCETDREQAWKINSEGTRNLALACDIVHAKLIYISTDYVFDGEKGNYAEEDRPNPINFYGTSKLEGERQVAKHCHDYLILRTSVLYGSHPWKQDFVTWVTSSLRRREEIAVVEDHYTSPTLVDNLAHMTIEALEKDLAGLYHASGSQRISRFEFARQIAQVFALDQDLIKPTSMSRLTAWVAKRPRDSSLNTISIQKQLETRPLNIAEGLESMDRW